MQVVLEIAITINSWIEKGLSYTKDYLRPIVNAGERQVYIFDDGRHTFYAPTDSDGIATVWHISPADKKWQRMDRKTLNKKFNWVSAHDSTVGEISDLFLGWKISTDIIEHPSTMAIHAWVQIVKDCYIPISSILTVTNRMGDDFTFSYKQAIPIEKEAFESSLVDNF